MNTERFAYINGEFVSESNAHVSIRDTGLVYGDSVFDTARTFNGKIFRLEQHIDRLLQSLDKVRIDPGLSRSEWIDRTNQLVAKNLPLLRDGEDYWVTQRVTNGLQQLDGETMSRQGPTVIIDCVPIPLRARARLFRDGIDAAIAERKRIAPDALSPNIKSNNYLNMMLAQRELQTQYPNTWALMCDPNGNIAEGAGCNFFIVKDGAVVTPEDTYILCGISRDVVTELCRGNGISITKAQLSIEDAVNADEAFFTSTSLCVCPVRSVNGIYYSQMPGLVTRSIMDLFKQLVDFDYEAQYMAYIGEGGAGTGL